MTTTPRATPVVQPPRQAAPISERVPRKRLSAPIVLVTTIGEWELDQGSLIIGRDSSAAIVLDDSLVSRFHARITVCPNGEISLEDLQSANGIFVNGMKVSRPSVQLEEGDRLLIGTTELSVFGTTRTTTIERAKPVARVHPTKAVQSPPVFAPFVDDSQPQFPRRRPLATTGRSDAINLVGQFAEQLMASGHPLEAVRALSEHLQNLMKGASAGLTVPARILETATQYALKLHAWTQRDSWFDYIFELHLASLEVPSTQSLYALEQHLAVSTGVDRTFLTYFVTTLERRLEGLSVDEQQRLRRIVNLSLVDSNRTP